MGRVSDILANVRDILAEETPDRWTDEHLLRLLSKVQKKIARETYCLRAKATIELCDGHFNYVLDDSFMTLGTPFALSQVINTEGAFCTFWTTKRLEKYNEGWQDEEGAYPTHIIYDRREPLHFRVYPIPTASKLDTGETFNTTNNPVSEADQIVTEITGATLSNFDIEAQTTPHMILVIFYYYPPNVTTIADTNLLVPEIFDTAIEHYMAGMAFRADHDEQNRSLGKEELSLFNDEYKSAADLAMDQFTEDSEIYAPVSYNAVIE